MQVVEVCMSLLHLLALVGERTEKNYFGINNLSLILINTCIYIHIVNVKVVILTFNIFVTLYVYIIYIQSVCMYNKIIII